jgi:hypothetical protein
MRPALEQPHITSSAPSPFKNEQLRRFHFDWNVSD